MLRLLTTAAAVGVLAFVPSAREALIDGVTSVGERIGNEVGDSIDQTVDDQQAELKREREQTGQPKP